MPDTRGFEVVAEVMVGVLREFLDSAWENGGTSDPGSIPHEVEIPQGITFPGTDWAVDHGQVSIPQEGLNLDMAPADNGVTVTLGTSIQVAMDPETIPVDTLSLLNMTADIIITAPFGVISGTENNIGIIFQSLPRDKVDVQITSGNPIGPVTLDMIEEYIHTQYEDEVIPHNIPEENISLGPYSADVYVEIYDDPVNTDYSILVADGAPGEIDISIPVYFRLNNMSVPLGTQPVSPMGVLARVVISAPLITSENSVTAQLTAATISVRKFDNTVCSGGDYCTNGTPCLIPADGTEGSNYTINKTGGCFIGSDLESLLISNISSQGQLIINALGDIVAAVPGVEQIEDFIGDHVHSEIVTRQFVGTWTPETPEGSAVEIDEVRPKALADALAIAINPKSGAANENLLTNLIPSGSPFAIALDADFVEQTITDIMNKPEDEGGFGGIPKTFDNIEGHRADLQSLSWDLRDGAIHFWGDVKVHDVFCGADATASFWVDIGLRWTAPDAEGAQTLEPFVIDKDVDIPWWAWLLVVIGFIISLIIGIVVLVVTIVIENVAEKIGGAVIEDEVSGQLQALGAWPQELQGVGTVTSVFDTEVIIDSRGLLFFGEIDVTSTYSMALISAAGTGGPHTGFAASPMFFDAGFPNPDMEYHWEFGDGNSADGHSVSHTYADDGIYVLRLTMVVNEPGGATTHESSIIYVKNVAPDVNAGADRTINEGEMLEYIGQFTDPERPDTHEASWNFGDDSLPVQGTVVQGETTGSVSAQHAYGDNGTYNARLTVQDDDGGVSFDDVAITVLNVPPTVDAGPDRYAYKDFPIRLIANFTDPGWLDTHVGSWDFGDCAPVQMGVIEETNEPPQGEGEMSSTHIYRHCGVYLANAMVVDDDGGAGTDQVHISVVELNNSDFESGFQSRQPGVVANAWEPYTLALKDPYGNIIAAAASMPFSAEEFIESNGRRAQKIANNGALHAGIYQHIGANPGWEYEIQARYHLAEAGGGLVRAGIDPGGGDDPESLDVVWVNGYQASGWSTISIRVAALQQQITVFIEALQYQSKRGVSAYIDEVNLYPHQPICKLVETCESVCVNFATFKTGTIKSSPFTHQQLTFTPLGNSVSFADLGEPQSLQKLIFLRKGVRIDFPQAVDNFIITVNNYSGRQLRFRLYNGVTLVHQFVETIVNEVRELSISQPDMTAVEVSGGNNESGIVEICLCLPEKSEDPEVPCEDRCIGFDGMKTNQVIHNAFIHQALSFSPLGEYGCRPVTWGKPDARTKLVFPREGLRIDLPQSVDLIDITVNNYNGDGLDFLVYVGDIVEQSFFEALHNDVKSISIQQSGITALEIKGGGNEAAVVEICLCLPSEKKRVITHVIKSITNIVKKS